MIGIGSILVALLIGGFLLWRDRASYLACGLYVALSLCVGMIWYGTSGLPKPFWMEYPKPVEATVLHYSLDEPNAIYLWVAVSTSPTPISYVLPWSEPVAKQLSEASDGAKKMHGTIKVKLNGRKVEDGNDPQFYPAPPEENPPKIEG